MREEGGGEDGERVVQDEAVHPSVLAVDALNGRHCSALLAESSEHKDAASQHCRTVSPSGQQRAMTAVGDRRQITHAHLHLNIMVGTNKLMFFTAPCSS